MPPRKNLTRTKTDKDNEDVLGKEDIETKTNEDIKEVTIGEKKEEQIELKEEVKEGKEEIKEEIKESWDDNAKEHTDEEEIKDERRVYKVDMRDEHDERRGRQKSIVDFDYHDFANISRKVNEMSTEDLIKYLIVRSHSEGQVPLCNALKFVLRGKNCEVSLDRMTSEPRIFNRGRGRGSDRTFQRRPMRRDTRDSRGERTFRSSNSSLGRPKYDD